MNKIQEIDQEITYWYRERLKQVNAPHARCSSTAKAMACISAMTMVASCSAITTNSLTPNNMNKQDNKRTAAVAAAAAIGSAGSAIGTDAAIHTLNSDTAQETDIDNRPENVVHITSQEPHVEVISTSDILNQQNDNHNNHVDPVTPVEPVDPVTPVEPVDPVTPVEPVDPVIPVEPVDHVNPVEPVDLVNPNISLDVMYGGPSGLEDPIGDIEPVMYGGPIDDDLMGVPYIPEEDEMIFLSDDMSTDTSVNTDSDMDVIL